MPRICLAVASSITKSRFCLLKVASVVRIRKVYPENQTNRLDSFSIRRQALASVDGQVYSGFA